MDELNGEKIDILKWEEQPEVMIATALKPAQINALTLNYDTKTADVSVDEDQLSLAIGRRGANVRLASRLCGWDIQIAGEKGAVPPDAAASPTDGASPPDGAGSPDPASNGAPAGAGKGPDDGPEAPATGADGAPAAP